MYKRYVHASVNVHALQTLSRELFFTLAQSSLSSDLHTDAGVLRLRAHFGLGRGMGGCGIARFWLGSNRYGQLGMGEAEPGNTQALSVVHEPRFA